MYSHLKYFLLFLLIYSATACETDVDNVNLPKFKQKLVINSFLSPSDTISYVYISSNKKLYGELNSEEPLGKLTGFISDGINEVELDTSAKGLKFSNKSMQIRYGQTYKIKITSESGLSVEGICTVPEKKNFQMQLDTFSVHRQIPQKCNLSMAAVIEVSISKQLSTILPERKNFYRIQSTTLGYYKDQTTQEMRMSEGYLTFDKEYNTDKGRDGKTIVFTNYI